MKRKLLLLVAMCLSCLFMGCGHAETREYPVESARYYTETEKSGIFKTTESTHEFVEFIYVNSEGKYEKESRSLSGVHIANESKVVEEEGSFGCILYLSLEDYNKLLGEE